MKDRRDTRAGRGGVVPRLRRRVILAFAGAVAATALLLAGAAYLIAQANSEDAALDAALDQSRFNLLLADSVLPESPQDEDYTELLRSLRIRGTFETLLVTGDETYVSGPQVATSLVSNDLAAAVEAGRLAYQAVTVGSEPALAVGGTAREGGLSLYFFYPQGDRIEGLHRLRNNLVAGGVILSLLGLIAGAWLADRILRPVAAAASAATRMSHGELDTRLPEGPDEFGALAASFNRMAENLQAKIEDLEAARARERRFVADAAHELRTPVAALTGEASLLESQLGPEPEDAAPDHEGKISEREYRPERLPAGSERTARMIVRDVRRLRTLIDELLEMSRIDSLSAEIQEEQVDLEALWKDIQQSGPWSSDDVRISNAVPGRTVWTDPLRLERILRNLTENAWVHGSPPIDVEIEDAAEGARIRVTDHGPGILEANLPQVFDRFFKADPSRSSGPGSGLGLAIAQENARILGGSLSAANSADAGASFTLHLPPHPPGPRPDQRPPAGNVT